MSNYLLVDAKNLLWRAEAAMGQLAVNGKATGGVHGFLTVLLRVTEMYRPKVVICWDDWKHGPAARRAVDANYKVREPEVTKEREDALKRVQDQQNMLITLFKLLGVKQVRSPKWEADDVMGTLAKRYGERGRVLIFTGDRDLFQCITPSVQVLRPATGGGFEDVTHQNIHKEYGVNADQWVEYKALVGDPSDGYKGCPGIGDKGAHDILHAFGTIAKAVHAAEKTPEFWVNDAKLKPRLAKLLIEGADDIERCRKLATINTDAPLKFLKREPDARKAMGLLAKWQMKQLLTQFSKLKALAWEVP